MCVDINRASIFTDLSQPIMKNRVRVIASLTSFNHIPTAKS